MAKFKKFSLAVFETPTECRECPCAHISPGYHADRCQLLNRLINYPTSTEPKPDWCPLKPIIFDEEYKDEAKANV